MIIYSSIVLLLLVVVTFLKYYPAFGARPSRKKRNQLNKSKNYSKGKFKYPIASRIDYSPKAIWMILREFLKGNPKIRPQTALPVQQITKSMFSGHPGKAAVTWLGHSTAILELDGKIILLDPVFGAFSSPFKMGGRRYNAQMPIEIENLPEIDMVLISHDHYDHLEYQTIKKLKNKAKKFLVPLGVGSHLERWGIDSRQIIELDWWEETEWLSLKFRSTPARHASGRGVFGTNATLWCSWIIQGKDKNIFFSGDSGYGPHFKRIGEKYGPFDLTLIEAGQYDSRGWWPLHMLPEETIQAHLDLRGSLLLPIHWGAFTLAFHDWNEPIERVLKAALERHVLVTTPRIGEAVGIGLSHVPVHPWWRVI